MLSGIQNSGFIVADIIDFKPPDAAAAVVSPQIPPGKPRRKNLNMSGLRPWKKGQSGNPGGRPKRSEEFVEECRTLADQARNTLVEVMSDPKALAVARVNAAKILIERGYGQASQDMKLNVKSSIDDYTDTELAAIAAAASGDSSKG